MVILLVDGDQSAREARAALLTAAGHAVLQAGTAVEAVHIAQDAPLLDLLVTEVILDEDAFGFDLSEAIRVKLAEMRTLYTTRFDLAGYENDLAGAVPVPATAPDEEFLAAVKAMSGPEPEPATLPQPPSDEPSMPRGAMLGNYQVISHLYSEPDSETYRAMQHTVQRPVALVLLRPHLLKDPDAVARFREREKVKARITHPRVAPLYEAGEANGWLFYTREIPPGRSLQEIASAGETLNERQVVDVLYRVAEVMSMATEKGFYYRTFSARDIYVDGESHASIVNIFRPPAALPRDPQADVRSLLELLAPLAPSGKAHSLLHDLSQHPHDWTSLFNAIEDIRSDLSERSLLNRAKSEDIAVATPASRPWLLMLAGVAAIGLVAYLGVLSGSTGNSRPDVIAPELVEIPAGPFIFGKGERRELPAFWISKYEVTIGQYAEFLKALKTVSPSSVEDPNQPRSKTTHEPADWAKRYEAASTGGLFNGQPLTLNHPVAGVDYWDAVAYAKWRGQKLPTEEQWEKAARGPNGNLYPWGNNASPKAANLGEDFVQSGSGGGSVDGHNLWSPVNLPPGDISAYGVVGMAGNVQEWTSTWQKHPEIFPDKRVPLLRGGHFGVKASKGLLTTPTYPESADETNSARGFRTVSDQAPTK